MRLPLPRVDPVGIVEAPAGYRATPRSYPRRVRALALAVLVAFAVVAIGTTALSLGRYCITTDAGRPLPPS